MHRFIAVAATLAIAVAQEGPNIALNTCNAFNIYQVWKLGANPTPNFSLVSQIGGNTMCIDIKNFATTANATVYTWPCGDGSKSNEFWTVNATSIQSQDGGNQCLVTFPGVGAAVGAYVTTGACDGSPASQFTFDSSSGFIKHIPSGLCIDAHIAAIETYCSLPPQNTWTVCDPTAAIDDRAADIVSRLSLTDKIAALGTGTPALSSVGLPEYNWWSEATHGISHVHYDNSTPYASNTALPITTGCSFNRTLWKATGNQIGREARAFMNQGNAYSTYWAPVINTVRDPRWGRNLETPGEDPFLVGQYAVYFVQGFEHAPEDPYTLQASACCKHFAANELDGWNGTDRYHFNAIITQQDLADSYLPPFQDCVTQGKVSGIMCSYNAINGVPSCANDWLLGTVLRNEWAFDGYVTSDCDADQNVYDAHHYTDTPEEAVADVLHAGTDVDCGGFVPQYANSTLSQGLISVDDIDTVLKRLFRMRIRLGFFDPAGPLQKIGTDQICNPYATELARDGVRQGTVLLKNDANTLPLNAAAYKSAAVIGPNGNYSHEIAFYYGGQPCFNQFSTMIDAITQHIPSTTFVAGLPTVTSTDTSGFAAAIAAAQAADVIVLSLGIDLTVEHEGMDRVSTDLPNGQKWLIGNITAVAKGKPVIAVTYAGGMVDVSAILNNTGVQALLHAGYPSVQAPGVGDVIFGKTLDGRTVVPAARMTQTIYSANYPNTVSLFDFNMRPGPSVWPPGSNPGRTHRFYTDTPVLPFGYGLSYTTFTYTPVDVASTVNLAPVHAALSAAVDTAAMGLAPAPLTDNVVSYFINVTNTGSVDADDVVLGFMVPPGAGTNGVPLQELFGFERVFVPVGQTVTVYLGVQGKSFTQVNENGVRKALTGEYTVRFGLPETSKLGMGFAEFKVTAA